MNCLGAKAGLPGARMCHGCFHFGLVCFLSQLGRRKRRIELHPTGAPPCRERKPAAANVDASGNYTMSPSADTGGAVTGQHRVTYSAPVMPYPEGVEVKPGQGPPPSPFDGLKPKEEFVEVKAGSNTIDIELVK